MESKTRTEQILRDIRKVNFKVNTLINEIQHNIEKTNQEILDRSKSKSPRQLTDTNVYKDTRKTGGR